MKRAVCHDCNVLEGELHKLGCDMEVCPFCGGQLISCDCCYEKLGLYLPGSYDESTCHLPPEVYSRGLNKDQQAKWDEILQAKGRIPWIQYPNICAKCGMLWPDLFSVSDQEWEHYIEPGMRDKLICRSCYNWIKEIIDEGTKSCLS